MCGLAGVYSINCSSQARATDVCTAMTAELVHRGPDDAGIWQDGRGRIALGHRRLSILDLSPLGHQPMVSSTGRYVIVFNGEIYNHLIIRSELESSSTCAGRGTPWRGHSDTETILAAVECWGVERTVAKLNGMFAAAVYDNHEQSLYLFRDRMGEKPMYYGWVGNIFVFASELKAITAVPGFTRTIDIQALQLYMQFGYVPGPFSIYKGIFKLRQGTMLKLDRSAQPGELPPSCPYWELTSFVLPTNCERRFSDSEVVDRFETLLNASVKQQMLSDVPLGAFFSGGLDSSLIVSLMQKHSTERVKTFTIGFREAGYNEADYARDIAHYLGTDHTELYVTPQDAMDIIPQLPCIYDEPFADNSQLPTILLSRLTRQQVTVALSGDGGDELFGGYNRYLAVNRLASVLQYSPVPLRQALASVVAKLHLERYEKTILALLTRMPLRFHVPQVAEKILKLSELLAKESIKDIYGSIVTKWDNGAGIVKADRTPLTSGCDPVEELAPLLRSVEGMMIVDALTYLTDDILVKVDRAAMAVSLETRVPFLDHSVVEFAMQLPLVYKIRNGKGKWIVRELLQRYLPSTYFERPKSGFGVPVGKWLRGPLRDWAEELLAPKRLGRHDYFDVALVQQVWQEHLSERKNHHAKLWTLLMFEAWLDGQKSTR